MARSPILVSLLALSACTGSSGTDVIETGDETADTGPTIPGACERNEVRILTGTLVDDTELDAICIYHLRGTVYVGAAYDDPDTECIGVESATLTIPAGTRIRGELATGGALVVNRCSSIVANGTEDQPIVMSSTALDGQRARGDWGGLAINGRARTNAGEQAFGIGATGFYGGPDQADNSGSLQYVRIEFAGAVVGPDQRMPGLLLQGVGSETSIDHVQVHKPLDSGVQLNGGTANFKHLLVTGPGEEGIRWREGWLGQAQWVVLQQHAGFGDNGIEGLNNETRAEAIPRSAPTLSNVTIIGQGNGDGEGNPGDIGLLLRRGTTGVFNNLIIAGFDEADTSGQTPVDQPEDVDPLDGGCLDFDDAQTFNQARPIPVGAGTMRMSYVLLDCEVSYDEHDQGADPFSIADWAGNQTNVLEADLSAEIAGFQDQVNPAFCTDRLEGSSPGDSFFDSTNAIGGCATGDNWIEGWTSFLPN